MSDTIQGAEMGGNFAEYIQSERDSLTIRRRLSLNERDEINRVLADIDREFAAIDAYERAKVGKATKPAASSGTKRARKGSRRQEIIDAIAAAPKGMSRGELIEHFGIKGDKSGEMAISNALTALTKSAQAERLSGRYYVNKALAQAAE